MYLEKPNVLKFLKHFVLFIYVLFIFWFNIHFLAKTFFFYNNFKSSIFFALTCLVTNSKQLFTPRQLYFLHNIGFMLSGSVLFIWSPIVCTSSLASFWEHVLFASTSVLLMMQSNTSTIYLQNKRYQSSTSISNTFICNPLKGTCSLANVKLILQLCLNPLQL